MLLKNKKILLEWILFWERFFLLKTIWMNNQVVSLTETIKSQEETIRSLESTLKQ